MLTSKVGADISARSVFHSTGQPFVFVAIRIITSYGRFIRIPTDVINNIKNKNILKILALASFVLCRRLWRTPGDQLNLPFIVDHRYFSPFKGWSVLKGENKYQFQWCVSWYKQIIPCLPAFYRQWHTQIIFVRHSGYALMPNEYHFVCYWR